MAKLARLFESGMIGSLEVKNRITMAPMNSLFADPLGFATERMIDYYVARAKGGVGLIDTQASYILREEHS